MMNMHYYEVLVGDGAYHSSTPLTYSHPEKLAELSAVSVPLRSKLVTGFVIKRVAKPAFNTKSIKSVVSTRPLPAHALELARWLSAYYSCPLPDALRLLGPSGASVRQIEAPAATARVPQSQLSAPLTAEQLQALKKIRTYSGTTVLLHGETGSGKTRVYLELAQETLQTGRSVIILTPEISLTSQLAETARAFLNREVLVIHSQLGVAARKKLWLKLLESNEPQVVVGARSALFSPLRNIGLIVVDEAHEPAYKQGQSPRYHANRVASQLGQLTKSKVILGSATPLIADYYLAASKKAVVRMSQPAISGAKPAEISVIDLKNRDNFASSSHISLKLIDEIKTTLSAKKQILIYLNRRGSARLILCSVCGWQLVCPNCDIPLVYHGDEHLVRCHTCGYRASPPTACPTCGNSDIVYRSAGTKALAQEISKLFPQARLKRFDSDNEAGQRLNELYSEVLAGKVDILVGTQLLAKGLDLPRLGLVGIISAESSLGLPDFSSEERSFQLLYQIIGRVGRGHVSGRVILQTFQPDSLLIKTAAARDYETFYAQSLTERQAFSFPPFAYLTQLSCKRASAKSAEETAGKLQKQLQALKLPIEVIGPATPFYARRGSAHYAQLILKSKTRTTLQEALKAVPASWQINIDPINLL